MERIDVTKTNLCIREFQEARQSSSTYRGRTTRVNLRGCDGFLHVEYGSCIYTVDGGPQFTVRPGDVFYLAADASYTLDLQTQRFSCRYFNFLFDAPAPRLCFACTPPEGMGARALFSRMLRVYRSAEAGNFHECMALAYQIYGLAVAAAGGAYLGAGIRQKLLAAKEYLERNSQDPSLTVAGLAKRAGVSEPYFRRKFQDVCGCGPARYLTQMRLNHAERLMGEEQWTLEECALQSGFSSLSYFCRVFKRNYGVTPAKYRREVLLAGT